VFVEVELAIMSKGDSIVKSENKSEGEKVRMRVDCESESDN
jgi:hypothetical protein